jgi:lysophospholipase L1-like esterase
LIGEFIASKPELVFVDVATPMLGSDGKPREELFVSDRLHLNDEGYKLWAGIVGPVLDRLDPPTLKKR